MASDKDILNQLQNLSAEQQKLLRRKLEQKTLSGHQIIGQALKDNGVSHIYSISGVPIHETLSSCSRLGIKVIAVRNQQTAAMMASAQNYLEGKLKAVVILSYGPAITNATTGILVAQDNCFPLLVIGARSAIQNQGIGCFQELNAIPIMQSITKLSELVDSTEKISSCIKNAIELTMNNRPGAVYLEIPDDIIDKKGYLNTPIQSNQPEIDSFDHESLQEAVALIKQAQRPVIIIGRGLRWNEAYRELDFFINNLGIPFTTSPMARGYFPDNHPLCYNTIQSESFNNADLLFVVGAKLNWTFRFGAEFCPKAKVIQIDIHPEESCNNQISTLGIVGNAKNILQNMIPLFKDIKLNISNSWLDSLNVHRKEKQEKWELLAEDTSMPISPYCLIKEIREVIPEDAIVAVDGRVIVAAAQRLLPSFLPVSRFTPGTNGCIGTGIPFGIAAKVAFPNSPVIIITGDTAFGLNAMEMETAIRMKLNIIVIVANNDGNSGSLTQSQYYPPDYPDRVTMFQNNIHYEKIMEAFGGFTQYVEKPEQIRVALNKALKSEVASCINVVVNPATPYPEE